jgi:hypothetical protein
LSWTIISAAFTSRASANRSKFSKSIEDAAKVAASIGGFMNQEAEAQAALVRGGMRRV